MGKCKYCGYNLYPLDKVCPECGAEVEQAANQVNSASQGTGANEFKYRQNGQGGRAASQYGGQQREPVRVVVVDDEPRWGVIKLIFGILSIILFFIVSFQSCAAGLGNALSGNGESSGSAGFLCALLFLIAGIVGICVRKKGIVAHSIVCGFYYFIFVVATAMAGSYADLKIWGVVGFIFGAVYLFSALRTKKGYIIGSIISILIFIMFIAAGGSGSSDSASDSTKNIAVESSNTDDNAASNTIAVTSSDVNGTQDKDLSVNTDVSAENAGEEQSTESDSSSLPTIDEAVILDNSDVVVKAVELVNDSIWGPALKLNIENNSSANVTVGCDALIVNDYMITDLFAADVAAGKKSNETLNLFSSGLKAAGIDNIGKIELYLHLTNSDTYDSIYHSDCITIETSEYANMDVTANDAGKEIYNDNGVRVVAKYVDEDSFWGKSVLLYLENNRDDNVSISVDDMSINGYMVSPFFSSTVYAGKKAVDDITLMSSDLESNGITSVDEIELAFNIYNADSYSNIVKTDPITFTTD